MDGKIITKTIPRIKFNKNCPICNCKMAETNIFCGKKCYIEAKKNNLLYLKPIKNNMD